MEIMDKKILLEHSFGTVNAKKTGRRKGTELIVLQFKKDKLKDVLEFPDVESAREKLYPKSRYNYIHTRFTEAKKRGKKIVHLKESPLGEVFIIKKKEIQELSSILYPYIK